MIFYLGNPEDMGHVGRLPETTFPALCTRLAQLVRLKWTREQFFAMPEKDKTAIIDRARAKRVQYLTPAEFKANPSPRHAEHAVRCNLIILDVDTHAEAKRLLSQRWDDCMGSLGFLVWHTSQSTPEAPRLRILVPAHGILPDRYIQAARTVAEMVGLTTITSQVTFHAVQPAFVPTCFSDDPAEYTPIVASNPDGDAFMAADIIDDADSSYVDSTPAPGPDIVADLAYLRAPMEGITLEHAAEALGFLDPDMAMQPWIEVAAGLKHQFETQPKEAFALWDAWSAKGSKYQDTEETQYRWNTLKAQPVDRAPVTIRSVFKLAVARGWSNPTLTKQHFNEVVKWLQSNPSAEQLIDHGTKRIAKAGPFLGTLERKALIVSLKEAFHRFNYRLSIPDISREVKQIERDTARATGLLPWAKGLCYVTALNAFYRYTTNRKFTPEVLDLMYSVPQIGEDKPPRPRDYVVQTAGCAQVENLRYDPANGEKRFFNVDNVPYVNTYRANYAKADPTRADEAGAIVEAHIAKLIRESEYGKILLSFMAYLVQQPGRKIRWAPLIQSGEGAGKGTLHAIMAVVLGSRNAAKVSGHTVMNFAYNDWCMGHQLVSIEEVRIIGKDRHAIMDKLKPLITDDEIGVDKKFEDHRSLPNITNYMMFTNYHDALAIREDGRRYFVLQSPLQTEKEIRALEASGHYRGLYDCIRDNAGGLRAWFEAYQLSDGFDPNGRAPVTPYLKEFASNAASPLAAAVADCIDDEPHALVRRDLLSLGCLRGSLDSTHLAEFSDQALASVLRELGWQKYGRHMVDGSMHQLWTKGEMRDARAHAAARLKFL